MEVFGWGKSKGSGGFCMVLVWFSYGFSMVLVRFSYGFSWVFIYCNIYRNILQLLDVPWSWWHIWLVGQGHPVLKNMSSSIGMMTETQYFWENSKNGNQTTNQIWGFPEMGVPPNGWFIMEKILWKRMMTGGTTPFQETPILPHGKFHHMKPHVSRTSRQSVGPVFKTLPLLKKTSASAEYW